MQVENSIIVIVDTKNNSIIPNYTSNLGIKHKAIFTSVVLAKDAIANMVRNDNRSLKDLLYCRINSVGKVKEWDSWDENSICPD